LSHSIEIVESKISTLLLEYLQPIWEANPAGRTEISGTTNLVSDLTLDSFQVMEFLMEVEDEYDIAMDMNSLSEIHTVRDLAGAVLPLVGN
jgi:acyl carrier protein